MNKLLLLIVLLLKGTWAFCQPGSTIEKYADSIFSAYTPETPGAAVAVVKDGVVVLAKGYGSAQLEYTIPITEQTVFHVASVSKQVTAFAIYLLAQQGKIALNDNIRLYFPELPDYGAPVLIKHLLGHTSGLRDQWALLTLAGWRMDDVITTGQILKLVCRQEKLNFSPGTQFLYCNTGYTLLAELVHRVTGQSFAAFTKENIFQPLGMSNSQFCENHNQLIKNRAYSYELQDGTRVKKKLNYSTVGATSLFTTVSDLAKWCTNFTTPVVGNKKLIEDFTEISRLNNNTPVIWSAAPGDTTYHAKGQLHYYYKGVKVISHGGHDAGFRSVVTRFPDNNLSIIILSNDEHISMFRTMTEIADFYLKDDFVETVVIEIPNNTNNSLSIEKYNTALDKFTGNYSSRELNTSYRIVLKKNQLFMTHDRLEDIELVRTGETTFSGVNTFPIELVFQFQEEIVSGLAISNFGAKEVQFTK